MKKILILGVTGMLGSTVYDVLSKNIDFDVRGTARNPKDFTLRKNGKIYSFDAETDNIKLKVFSDFVPDYIINCIGIIKPYCKDNDPQGILRAIKVNALFPYLLVSSTQEIKAKVIQIATDCVYSGTKGKYTEKSQHDALDVYGKTKSLGEVQADNFLNIRCSIIGPELKNKTSLLEWFLSRKSGEKLTGFTHHLWNGVSTLQFAKLCHEIIKRGENYFSDLTKKSYIYHYTPNVAVSKYELLNIFKKVFKKDVMIEEVGGPGPAVDRTLSTDFVVFTDNNGTKPMEYAIEELYEYMTKR